MNILATKLINVILATTFVGWMVGVAHAQNPDYFGGINQDNSSEITLELERTPTNDSPADMITFDALTVTITGAEIADTQPNLRNPDLVQHREVQNNGRVAQGTVLEVSLTINGPNQKNWRRRTRLFSTVSNPENRLSENVVDELGGADELSLDWRRTTHDVLVSYAPLRKSVSFSRSNTGNGNSDFTGSFQLHTANLKPGKYRIWVRVYRLVDDETVEKDTQKFNFTVVDAALSLVADLPSSVATFDEDKSAQNVRYPVMLSDWAVPPLSAVMEANVPGITLDFGEMATDELDGNMFSILLMPPQGYAGDNTSFTLRVRDGLGRTATLSHRLAITDGASGEIQVDMPSMVEAGDTIYGTITYPDGYTLVKPPRIADRNGFEWTSSDYTSFRISVQEEGVHHRRLFAIVARGQMAGVDFEPVLTWKREYDVISQDLIFNPAARQRVRDERKANADDRRSAFVQLMIGDGSGEAGDGNDGSSAGTREVISTETFENEDVETGHFGNLGRFFEDDERQPEDWSTTSENTTANSTNAGSDTSSRNLHYVGRDGPPLKSRTDKKMQSICGVTIDGYADRFTGDLPTSGWWLTDYDQNSGRGDFDDFQGWITLMQEGMPGIGDNGAYKQENDMKFYAEDCVRSSESIAQSDGIYREYEYYSNGGRQSMKDSNTEMEWDRSGNITYGHVGNLRE